MRKAVRNNERKGKMGKGREQRQRRRTTANSNGSTTRAVARALARARHCSLLGSLFLFLLSSFHFSRRASKRRAPWALLCLSSTLRSFVLFRAPLEGLIAAHTRSPFVSSFCHLFSTTLFSLSSQPSGSPPSSPPSCSFARCTPRPMHTTDHDADREGRLSHSPLSRVPLEYSRCTYALPLVAFSSHPTSSEATRRDAARRDARDSRNHDPLLFSYRRQSALLADAARNLFDISCLIAP